jgi:hypothetical protein
MTLSAVHPNGTVLMPSKIPWARIWIGMAVVKVPHGSKG